MMNHLKTFAAIVAFTTILGCTTESSKEPTKNPPKEKQTNPNEVSETTHSGWWCNEHGIPEEECTMCNRKVFKKLKPEEICPNHPDRSKDQCFICNPANMEKYAAKYRAKYGKEPPEPNDNMPEKKEKK